MRLAVLGAFVLLAVTAPVVSAQNVPAAFFRFDDLPLLVPGAQPHPFDATLTVDEGNTLAAGARTADGGHVTVDLATQCDPGFQMIGPSVVEIETPITTIGQTSRYEATVPYTATAADDAVGLSLQSCVFTAIVRATTTDPSSSLAQTMTVTAAYRASAAPAGAATVQGGDGGQVVSIPVTCTCNAETQFVVDATQLPKGVTATVQSQPFPFNGTASRGTLAILVSGAAGRGLDLTVTPTAVLDPMQAGDAFVVHASIPGGGFLSSPGPVAPALLVLMALAAVVARRR